MQAVKLKRLALSIGRGTSPDYDDEGSALFINQACIYWGRLKLKSAKRARETSHPKGSRGSLQRNDVLINSTGTGTLGRAKLFNLEDDQSYFADSHVTIFRPNTKEANPRFITYLMESPEMQDMIYKLCVSGSTNQIELSKERFSNLTVNIMSTQTQQKIADFLDNETAQIDKLIAKQERLLELLEEKRRATITHAVTRGLNPNVELKETNIPWLSEIPQHWHVVAARRLFAQRKERAFPGQEQLTASQKYGVITQRNYMNREKVRIVIVEKDHEILKQVEPGDFVISMRSFQGGLEYSRLRGSISSAYVMLFRLKDIDDEYFKYLFKCDGYIQMLQSTSNLIRDGQAMRYANFIQVPLPLPPKDEQKDIAIYLDKENANCNQLKQKIQTQITLLRERRTSLISHAVTGKVKIT